MSQIKLCGSFSLLWLLLFTLIGCTTQEPLAEESDEPLVPKPVSIVFIDTPGIGEEVARRWSAETGGEADIKELSLAEFSTNSSSATQGRDVVVYPAMLLGDLVAADLISEIPDASWDGITLESRGLLRNNRTTLARFADTRFAIPISNPHYVLMVRKKLLDSSSRRLPTTWDELVALADEVDELDQFQYPVAIACGQGWAAKSLIAVAAADIRQRGNLNTLFNRRSVEPLLTSEPFVRAIKRLKKLAGANLSLTPQAVLQDYASGKAAIAIGWSTNTFFSNPSGESAVYDDTLVSRLPGTKQAFDIESGKWSAIGGAAHRVEFTGFNATQISVLKSASHPMHVYRFIEWLGSKQTTSAIMPSVDFGSPTRAAHLGDLQHWVGDVFDQQTIDQYSDLLTEASDSPIYCLFPRIRGSKEYFDALETAVQSFLAGELDAEAALQQAATKWEEITEQYGRKNQAEMLRKDESL